MKTTAILAAALTMMVATAGNAAIIYSDLPATAVQSSPGSLSASFNAAAGAGTVAFDINGYASLDGVNCCTDTFTLALNGTDIYSGSFALGGGGANTVFFAPVGSTQTVTQFAFFGGGVANIFVPLTLVAGNNTLTFTYAGAAQGLGDEGWGLQNVVVNGNAVPEPAEWAMLIAGFGLVGAIARRQRGAVAV